MSFSNNWTVFSNFLNELLIKLQIKLFFFLLNVPKALLK